MIENYKINNNFKIMIRQATDSDLELLMAWRSNPLIYKLFFIQKEPLKWDEHYSWWIRRENRIDWMILIEENNVARRIGSVNVSQLDTDNPEIGVFIGELRLWGKHIGRYAVLCVLRWLKNIGHKRTHVRIRENNIGSIRLFESLGFKKVKEGGVGEWIYEGVCDYEPQD
jgi:RimJ/RimL family protein N-acetyltransferase